MSKLRNAGAGIGAAALAALLSATPLVAVMPTRRPEFGPGFDMNELVDIDLKRKKSRARKERMKAVGQRAWAN